MSFHLVVIDKNDLAKVRELMLHDKANESLSGRELKSKQAKISFSIRNDLGENKRWAVDSENAMFFFKVVNSREESGSNYFIFFNGCFVELVLSGLNDVKIINFPAVLKAQVYEFKEAIKDAFKVHGRWGAEPQEGDFSQVDAEFEKDIR